MSTKLRLGTVHITFGPNYKQADMALLMQHIGELTRINQKFIQMLLGGQGGQVLTKIDEKDLHAEWGEGGGGGGDCCIDLEPGQLAGRKSETTGTFEAIDVGEGLDIVDGVLINLGVEGPEGPQGDPGTPGADGALGSVGPPGMGGMDGEDGEPGPPGGTGPVGATGATGSTGPTGPPGMGGMDGEDGTPGIPGPVGPQGVAGSGSMVFVSETTVAGAAATNITVSGLDIATDYSYFVQIAITGAAAGAATINIFFNGDVTATNYERALIAVTGDNSAFGGLSNGDPGFWTGWLRRDPTTGRVMFVHTGGRINGAVALDYYGTVIWDTNANLTSFTINSSVASQIAIGGKVTVWKLKNS